MNRSSKIDLTNRMGKQPVLHKSLSPPQKKKIEERVGWRCSSKIEYLPCMLKGLGSSPTTTKEKSAGWILQLLCNKCSVTCR